MKTWKLAIKNIRFRWMSQVLTLLLISMSIGLLWVVSELRIQSEKKLQMNLASTDLVIGAKGSPLQLILSAVYHLDAPTGNISLKEAERWMKHPMVREALPLAYGDYLKEFRIVGTTPNIIAWYDASLKEGEVWSGEGEAVIGQAVAKTMNLKVGDKFSGQHGDGMAEEGHGEYTVVGILQGSGMVLDQLILCSIETVWHVHEKEHHHEENPDEIEHEHEITAILLRYKNKMAAIQLPRMINENSTLQSAAPAIEINRISYLLNSGSESVRFIGIAFFLLAAFSMVMQFSMSMSQRKSELALLRGLGFSKWKIIRLVGMELLFIGLSGFLLGEIAGRIFLSAFSTELAYGSAYAFSVNHLGLFDIQLLLLPIVLSFLVILIYARQVFRISISDLLQGQ